MSKLTDSKRAAVIRDMVEGNSIRHVARMTGVSKSAVLPMLAEVGEFCAIYQDYKLRNLPCRRVEEDEIWGFCGAKEKNKPGSSALLGGHQPQDSTAGARPDGCCAARPRKRDRQAGALEASWRQRLVPANQRGRPSGVRGIQ